MFQNKCLPLYISGVQCQAGKLNSSSNSLKMGCETLCLSLALLSTKGTTYLKCFGSTLDSSEF